MGKGFILFMTMFSSLISVYAQSQKDTLVFHKFSDHSYQLVYIDKPNSEYHKKVISSLSPDSIEVNNKLKLLDFSNIKPQLSAINLFLGEWISTCKYKEKVYAYSPSEPYYNLYFKITDSTIILNDFNDGFVPYAIKDITKQNNLYVFKIISPVNEEHTLYIMNFKKNFIAVKSSLFNKANIWLTTKDNYHNLPIIVNLCPDNRCGEFSFE